MTYLPRGTYAIVNEEGKILEKCRIKQTAYGRLGKLKKEHGEKLKIEKIKE